jgi:hypothetical protein
MADNVDSGTSRFFCNLGAMTSEERTVYGALSRKLFGAGEEKRELDNGYAYRLAAAKVSLSEIADWITFERRCCPFFNLQIEAEPNRGPVWLRITGPAGVKEFIKSETGG